MIGNLQKLAVLAVLGLTASLAARAETVLVAQTGLISGKQSFVVPLQIAEAGQLTVRLTDLGWLGRLADLSFSLSTADGLLKKLSLESAVGSTGTAAAPSGVQMYEVTRPGAYYGYVSGAATGSYGLGLYSLSIGFEALNAPVPLPAAGWLLLSALGGIAAWKRRASRC